MKQNNAKNEKKVTKVLGIDLAKNSFQLHGVDKDGHVVLKKKLSRNKLAAFIVNLPSCLIGLNACGGAHHWVRTFTQMGHTVRMIAPQFVKPYVKSNKNDAVDAEGNRLRQKYTTGDSRGCRKRFNLIIPRTSQ